MSEAVGRAGVGTRGVPIVFYLYKAISWVLVCKPFIGFDFDEKPSVDSEHFHNFSSLLKVFLYHLPFFHKMDANLRERLLFRYSSLGCLDIATKQTG